MAAAALDKNRRRNKETKQEWSQSGSFVHKPVKGWLHPDEQLLPDAGVCYGVRYIGCMVVKHAMKALDFDTRTAIAKESISQVCDAAGLKTASKKSKRATKVAKYLGDSPSMVYAGSNVNLTITTESINMVVMENGETIGDHQMPGVSFASGGDPDTMDFVAYVAKDSINGRACYVLECGGGLAQDVITTIGQAFELRFKQFLSQRPEALPLPDRLENPVFGGSEDAWGNDQEYYNDRPGAMPPTPTEPVSYATPQNNTQIGEGAYNSVKDPNLLGMEFGSNPYDNSVQGGAVGNLEGTVYDNQRGAMNGVETIVSRTDGADYDNRPEGGAAAAALSTRVSGGDNLDAFDMKPFSSNLPAYSPSETSPQGAAGGAATETNLADEKWFHGKISRQQCEVLLTEDGDFLVRESSNSAGQFVLSGRQSGRVKHLLLVDPEGVVRTKDRTFDSVGHLIAYHLGEAVPITSNDSELMLRRPVNKFG